MAYRKRPFKITVINLFEKCGEDGEMRERLAGKKSEIDCLAIEATRLVREARVAGARASMALAQQEMAVQAFLVLAGEVDNQIARENSAMAPYTNAKGEICVDIPFTAREQRMAVRAAHRQLAEQAEEDGGEGDNGLFDEGEEENQ